MGRRQFDPSAWLITGLERCHLAWDVVRISPERQEAKRGIREDVARRVQQTDLQPCPGA